MRLLLFDIDGTLVDTAGAGCGALRDGMRMAFPREAARREMPSLDLAGATDSAVIRHLFEAFLVPHTTGNKRAFLAAYVDVLRERLSPGREGSLPGRILPGVTTLLGELRSVSGATLALLTGNTRAGAQVKLEAYRLDSYFDSDCGAYGCDHWDRNELGPVAVTRASGKCGHSFTQHQVTVIGDTPRDISCGKAIGARTIAVATGTFAGDALATCQPDHLLPDFSKVEEVVALMLEKA